MFKKNKNHINFFYIKGEFLHTQKIITRVHYENGNLLNTRFIIIKLLQYFFLINNKLMKLISEVNGNYIN